MHGASLMQAVGIATMIVPRYPGVLCAVGCALADVQHDYGQTIATRLDDLDAHFYRDTLEAQVAQGGADLDAQRITFDRREIRHFADMAYLGQTHTIRVAVEASWGPDELGSAFEKAYSEEYGDQLGNLPVLIETMRTTVVGLRPSPAARPVSSRTEGRAVAERRRPVYFGGIWVDTPIYDRKDLEPGMVFSGPAIVEQDDTTTVVDLGTRGNVDEQENLILEVEQS